MRGRGQMQQSSSTSEVNADLDCQIFVSIAAGAQVARRRGRRQKDQATEGEKCLGALLLGKNAGGERRSVPGQVGLKVLRALE
jgi:hypothetical protein